MLVGGFVPKKCVAVELFVGGEAEAIAAFREQYPDGVIEAVDDREVDGFCPCGKPIYWDQASVFDPDGVHLHADCTYEAVQCSK